MRRHLLLLSCLLFLFGVLARSAEARRFTLYSLAHLDAERKPALQVSANVKYGDLVFFKKEDVYQSVYELFLRIKDKKGNVVETAVLKKKVEVKDYKRTKSHRLISRLSKSFRVEPGEYVVEAALVVKGTQLAMQRRVRVVVPDFLASGIGMSKPLFFTVRSSLLGGLDRVVPAGKLNENRLERMEGNAFAEFDREPVVLVEVYLEKVLPESTSCILYFEVVDAEKKQVFYFRGNQRISTRSDRFFLILNVDEWEPGAYTLNAKVVMENPHREAMASTRFAIEFSRAMLGKKFEDTIEILSLIAKPEEIDLLRKASLEDRPKAWAEFWAKRDPNPETEENEALEEHLKRVRYVIENFSELQPGWKTDRGKVYIRYGPPDQVETNVDPYMQGEYLIWRYYSRNLVFIFYDRFGLGAYRLINVSAF